MFICAPDTLLGIADGKVDPIAAFTEQKLRVEGNMEKALRLKEIIELKKGTEKSAVKKAADKAVDTVVKTAARKAAKKVNKKK